MVAMAHDGCADWLDSLHTEGAVAEERPQSRRRPRRPPQPYVQPSVQPYVQPTVPPSQPASGRAGTRRLPIANPEEVTAINQTLDLIERGGPFEHRQDGVVFQNREGQLPEHPRGYFHEYTVTTPGLTHRGARRIVTGTYPETWYSNDHYRSFVVIDPRRY